MPKLDPYPPSPWSSESRYGGCRHRHSPSQAKPSRCWGKAVGLLRNRKNYDISTDDQECKYQMTQRAEVVRNDESSECSVRTSTCLGRILMGYSFFHIRESDEITSSIVQKPLERREPVEESSTNEKEKNKLDFALMKDGSRTSSNCALHYCIII